MTPVNKQSNTNGLRGEAAQRRRGLEWRSGGPIILPPRPASGCDTAIIWDLRINSATKGRSLRGTDSGDYAGRWKTSSCGETPRFKVNGLPNWEVMSCDNAGLGCRRCCCWNLPLNGIFSALQTELHPSSEFVNGIMPRSQFQRELDFALNPNYTEIGMNGYREYGGMCVSGADGRHSTRANNSFTLWQYDMCSMSGFIAYMFFIRIIRLYSIYRPWQVCVDVIHLSDLKISTSKASAASFAFSCTSDPSHSGTLLYFYFSFHPSALISLKSQPFISNPLHPFFFFASLCHESPAHLF